MSERKMYLWHACKALYYFLNLSSASPFAKNLYVNLCITLFKNTFNKHGSPLKLAMLHMESLLKILKNHKQSVLIIIYYYPI